MAQDTQNAHNTLTGLSNQAVLDRIRRIEYLMSTSESTNEYLALMAKLRVVEYEAARRNLFGVNA